MLSIQEWFLHFLQSLESIVRSINQTTQPFDIESTKLQLHTNNIERLVINDKDPLLRLLWPFLHHKAIGILHIQKAAYFLLHFIQLLMNLMILLVYISLLVLFFLIINNF